MYTASGLTLPSVMFVRSVEVCSIDDPGIISGMELARLATILYPDGFVLESAA